MKDIVNALVVGAFCLVVVACGSRGDQAWIEDSGLSPFAIRIQGNWWSDCTLSPDIGMTQTGALYMERETMKRTNQYSFSTECNTWDVEAAESYAFWVNGDVGNGMRELELEFKTATVTPKTMIGVTQLNGMSWCGITDWAVGVTRDVTSETGKDNCMPARRKSIKTVIKLEGEALMIGKMDEVSTSNVLNKDQIFRRPPPSTPTPAPADPDPVPTPVRIPDPTPTPTPDPGNPNPAPQPTPEPVPDPGDDLEPEEP